MSAVNPTPRKAACPHCGKLVAIHDPAADYVSPWFVHHRDWRTNTKCVGSYSDAPPMSGLMRLARMGSVPQVGTGG